MDTCPESSYIYGCKFPCTANVCGRGRCGAKRRGPANMTFGEFWIVVRQQPLRRQEARAGEHDFW